MQASFKLGLRVQELALLRLREERATSHSGRRTLTTKRLHDQGEHLKTVQQVLGHKDAATTTIYQDVPEEEMRRVLRHAGESYER